MFKINVTKVGTDTTIEVGFEGIAKNSEIVKFVHQRMGEVKSEMGGPMAKIQGPCSVAVAYVIAHVVNHLFGVVAVYDPKESGHIVVVSHDPAHKVGDVIK